MMFIFIVSSIGQTQYTSVPRTGEGRFDRSEKTVFWPNPIFFKPSVFFSASEANLRANRKWWRDDERLLPKPFIAHGYLPEDITLEELLDLAFEGSVNNYFSIEATSDNHSGGQLHLMQRIILEYLGENGSKNKVAPIWIGLMKFQNNFEQRQPGNIQFNPSPR